MYKKLVKVNCNLKKSINQINEVLTNKWGLSPAMLASTDKTQKGDFIFKKITSF